MDKPKIYQRDLAKLPKALAPLIERPQWAVWRWTQRPDGSFQKPPYMAVQPDRHASTNDPSTWTDYATALATVQSGQADGISYILTTDDPFAAIDLDHCCDPIFGTSVEVWAQNFLQYAVHTYQELTPSGTGVRIWGLASGDTLNRKFSLEIDGKKVAAELFRRTNKALTITGWTLDPAIRELAGIDDVIDWGIIWGERRKAAAEAAKPRINGNGFDSNGSKYSIDEIEQIVREGVPDGGNRSDTFHTIVGHYTGCDWGVGQIWQHLDQHPNGIGSRYLAEHRLDLEVSRSYRKWAELPSLPPSELAKWTQEWKNELGAKAPEPEPVDPELDDDDLDTDPELEDEELDGDRQGRPQRDPNLPTLYRHGSSDWRPQRKWLVKGLLPEVGHGLMSGQTGTYKTFMFFEIAAAVMTGQPLLGQTVKRQDAVLLIAAEGGGEVELRFEAVIREKCGGMNPAPFGCYKAAPALLEKGAVKTIVAMARQFEAEMDVDFGLPISLIGIDTIAASAGFRKSGDEQDNAVGAAIMGVLEAVAREMKCFVLGIDHFGKDLLAGTRGASSKEASADVVLALLGTKDVSGAVSDMRLAVRKQRAGKQGQQFPFSMREVEIGKDGDNDPITTLVVEWAPAGAVGAAPPRSDPWAQPKRQDQRTTVLRLKRVLMAELAEHGVDLPIPPDGPTVRMIDQAIVRRRFYERTPSDGTVEQKGEFRRKRFNRAVDWAEDQGLIDAQEIGGITYLWLARPGEHEEQE